MILDVRYAGDFERYLDLKFQSEHLEDVLRSLSDSKQSLQWTDAADFILPNIEEAFIKTASALVELNQEMKRIREMVGADVLKEWRAAYAGKKLTNENGGTEI